MDDLNEMNRQLAEEAARRNASPLDDFDGLSPAQMHHLIYDAFTPSCPVRLRRDIDPELLRQSPMFNLLRDLLGMLAGTGGLRLTQKGNLRMDVVGTLYGRGYVPEEIIEHGYGSLRSEDNWQALGAVKNTLKIAGMTRQQKNKLLLVTGWKKKFESGKEVDIFLHFLEYYMMKWNWAYGDLYENEHTGQFAALFILRLLHRYGSEIRNEDFYARHYFKAFPMMNFKGPPYGGEPGDDYGSHAVSRRFFRMFAEPFGLVEAKSMPHANPWIEKKDVKKTALLDALLLLEG